MRKNHQPEASAHSVDSFLVATEYKPWQTAVLIVLFYANTIELWNSFAITFLAPNVDFWCVSYQNNNNLNNSFNNTRLSPVNWDNSFIESSDHCSFISLLNSTFKNDSTTKDIPLKVTCTKWDYNLSTFSSTIIDEWDLVCDREWLISQSKSIYMFGYMISVLVFGQISDWVGRRPALINCYVITCLSGLLAAFSTSYVMFITSRFFQAFGVTGFITTGFVLLTEITNSSQRSSMGIAAQFGWALGLVTLPLVSWLIRAWFWLQLTISISIFPVVAIYWLIPESPRWLLTHKKWNKLEKYFMAVARKNKKNIEFDSIKTLLEHLKENEIATEKAKTLSVLDLFKTSKIRARTCTMAYLWAVNAFVYYGNSYNTNELWGNHYLNVVVLGITDFFSYLTVFFSSRYIGRRTTVITAMMVAGMARAAISFVPHDLPWMITALAMIGSFCIVCSFSVLYLFTTELFPTVVRNVAIGFCSTTARIGSIVAPFVRELGKSTYTFVPNITFTILAVSGGLLAFLLPETRNKAILDTLEEVENFEQKKSDSS